MLLLKGVSIGTLYKLLGSTISDRCNNFVITKIGAEEEKTPTVFGVKTILWNQRLGHIRGKVLRVLHSKCMVRYGQLLSGF
jgi:hypothetical protein